MSFSLLEHQRAHRDAARDFAATELSPWADRIDRDEHTPDSVLTAVRQKGYLGAGLPSGWGGGGLDPLSYGLVTEEIGKVSSTIRSLLTVQNMSGHAVAQFGSTDQKDRWLPDLCSGRRIIAFALTEPEAGSASRTLQTRAIKVGDAYRLHGTKRWVTYGMIADLFIVFAQLEGEPIAFVVDRATPGLEIEPLTNVSGAGGTQLAQLRLDDVLVEDERRLGGIGTGLSFVASAAIDHGRFSVAWGSTGIVQGCLEACLSYAEQRTQGDGKLKDSPLIQRQLADMLVAHTTSRALCHRSANFRERADPRAMMETSLAKYHASSTAVRVATEAVHLHGANGCGPDYRVSRYLREATVTAIIEGTSEMHQMALGRYALRRHYLD